MNLTFAWTAPNSTDSFEWYHRITLARFAKREKIATFWELADTNRSLSNLVKRTIEKLKWSRRRGTWKTISINEIGKLRSFENILFWNTIGSFTLVIDGLTREQIVSAYNVNIAWTSASLPQPVYQLFIASNGRARHKNRLKFYFPHWNLGRRPSGMKIVLLVWLATARTKLIIFTHKSRNFGLKSVRGGVSTFPQCGAQRSPWKHLQIIADTC